MPVRDTDLPPDVRARLGLTEKAKRATRTARAQPDQRWRCQCGEILRSEAAIEKHTHGPGHYRVELVLREVDQ